MARLTWVFAVRELITIRSAISSLDRPCATRATASCSRLVSFFSPATVSVMRGWVTYRWISSRVMDGASRASPRAATRTACRKSSGTMSLTRKPAAPARSASKT